MSYDKSPKFTHSKKDNNKAQGRSAHLTAIVVSLVLSIIMITISVFNVSAVVIDVSSHDGLIDWNRIEEHIEGVIIRIGYGNDIEGQDDKQAIRNMNECERLGIPYGVYIYSYALTSDEVTSEINHTLRMLQGEVLSVAYGLIWKMQTDTRRVMDLMYTKMVSF